MFKKGNKPKPQKEAKIKRDYRKWIKYGIWTLIIFWTLGSLRGFTAINRIADINAAPKEEVKEETVNFATGPAAENFTQKFLNNYFTWDNNNPQEREVRLKPFLMEDMDQQAGLRFGKETAKASITSTELWNIEETGKNTSKLTYKILYKTHHIEEVVKKVKVKDKVQNQVTKKEVSKGPFTKWIEVSIITDNQNFKVNSLPIFVSAPDDAMIEPEKMVEQKTAEPKTEEEIDAFLQTFFKQYTNGTREELQFLTTDKSLKPIGENISFIELEELKVYEKSKDGSYSTQATAIFKDSNTNAQMAQEFKLSIFEKDGRWQVKTIN